MLFSIHIPITSFFLIISFISNIRIFFPKYHYFATIKHKKASVSITDTEAFCLYIFLFYLPALSRSCTASSLMLVGISSTAPSIFCCSCGLPGFHVIQSFPCR